MFYLEERLCKWVLRAHALCLRDSSRFLALSLQHSSYVLDVCVCFCSGVCALCESRVVLLTGGRELPVRDFQTNGVVVSMMLRALRCCISRFIRVHLRIAIPYVWVCAFLWLDWSYSIQHHTHTYKTQTNEHTTSRERDRTTTTNTQHKPMKKRQDDTYVRCSFQRARCSLSKQDDGRSGGGGGDDDDDGWWVVFVVSLRRCVTLCVCCYVWCLLCGVSRPRRVVAFLLAAGLGCPPFSRLSCARCVYFLGHLLVVLWFLLFFFLKICVLCLCAFPSFCVL